MAFDYDGLSVDVDELIREFGQIVTVRRHSSGTYTPSTGAVAGSSITEFTAWAVFVPWEEEMLDGSKYEWNKVHHWGTEIQNQEARCLLSPFDIDSNAVTVGLEDEVIAADGTKFVVKKSTPVKPSGQCVLWDLKVA
jgi:hypothetical protein